MFYSIPEPDSRSIWYRVLPARVPMVPAMQTTETGSYAGAVEAYRVKIKC